MGCPRFNAELIKANHERLESGCFEYGIVIDGQDIDLDRFFCFGQFIWTFDINGLVAEVHLAIEVLCGGKFSGVQLQVGDSLPNADFLARPRAIHGDYSCGGIR